MRVMTAPLIIVAHKDCLLSSKKIASLLERNVEIKNGRYLKSEFGISLAFLEDQIENITKKIDKEAYKEYQLAIGEA